MATNKVDYNLCVEIDSVSRREIEGLNRLLKERERDHTREADVVRDSYREKVNDLKADQRDAYESVHRKTEEQADEVRRNFDEQISKNTDSYERKLAEERSAGYDRLGRTTSESKRELEKERDVMRKQVANYMDTNRRTDELETDKQDKSTQSLRDAFNKDRLAMKQYLDNKLNQQKQANSEQLAGAANDARDAIDANTRYLSELNQSDKLGSEIKYRKLAQNSVAEQDHMKRAFRDREQQLVDEKNLLAASVGADGEKELREYRDRSSNALQRIRSDNHHLNDKKDREHTDRLLETHQSQNRERQDLRAQFNQATESLKSRNDLEKAKNDIVDTTSGRRRKQEEFLANETLRKSSNLAQENLRSSYSDSLHDIEAKNQKRMLESINDLKKQMTKNEMQTMTERGELQQDAAQKVGEAYLRNARDKQVLVKTYQDRQDSLDELRKRQLEGQRQALVQDVLDTKAQANRSIAEKSLESQSKLYSMQQSMRNRNDELEMTRKADLEYANASYSERVKRLTETYHHAVLQQKEQFDDATNALRHETKIQMSKIHGDSDHEKRVQQHELQSKNRILMLNFETQLNSLKDQHTAEMDKLKSDNERAMRGVVKKTKETLDKERILQTRALEAKDLQMNERLKLQEEQLKAEIEKLKRTNELSLKKS